MNSTLFRSDFIAKKARQIAVLVIPLGWFALSVSPALANEDKPASNDRPMHFSLDSSDMAGIDSAANELADRLNLSAAQRTQVTELVRHRSSILTEQIPAARRAFFAKVDGLLTADQKKGVTLSETKSWRLPDWKKNVKDLTSDQTAELRRLLQQRDDAIWAAMTGAQKEYEAALRPILTAPQQAKLARIEADDSTIHIAVMMR